MNENEKLRAKDENFYDCSTRRIPQIKKLFS